MCHPDASLSSSARLSRLPALPLSVCLGLLPLLLQALAPRPAPASGGTVTNCSNDAQLSSLLAGGGAINFNCGPGPVTITLTSRKLIALPTSLDGGGRVTLSGANATRR